MIEVFSYEDRYLPDWENLVSTSVNGTFLSYRKFLGYHPPERFKDFSLVVVKDRKVTAVLPGCEISDSGKKAFISHPGTTYGGLILRGNPAISEINEILFALEAHLKELKFDRIVLKPAPYIFHSVPAQTIDFLLVFNGYSVDRVDLTTALDLTGCSDEEGVLGRCNGKTRNQCRLGAKNNLEFRRSTDFDRFHYLLENNLALHGVTPIHTVDELQYLTETLNENIELYGVYLDGEMVAGCWAFKFGKNVFHTQYLAMDYQYKHLAPMNFLNLKLIAEAAQGSFRYFNFGVSTEDRGRKINWNLFKFKESFGGGGVTIPSYQKVLS